MVEMPRKFIGVRSGDSRERESQRFHRCSENLLVFQMRDRGFQEMIWGKRYGKLHG